MALTLEIVTPDGVVWRGTDVDAAILPTKSGEIEVLEGHIPLITMLEAGTVEVVRGDKTEDLAIDRGYARVMGDVVSVLTEAAINIEAIDADDAEKAKEDAQREIEKAKKNHTLDSSEIERLEAVMRFSVAQILAKGKKKKS